MPRPDAVAARSTALRTRRRPGRRRGGSRRRGQAGRAVPAMNASPIVAVGVGVVVEQPGLAVLPRTGRVRRRGTAPLRGRRCRGSTSRSPPARRGRRRREPVRGHDLPHGPERRGRDDDIGSPDRLLGGRRGRHRGRSRRRDAPGPPAPPRDPAAASKIARSTSGQQVREHRQMATALDARADERDPRPAEPDGGAPWRMASPVTAAVRWAVIGPPSRIAVGTPVAASLSTTTAWMRRQPERVVGREAATHFIPSRSSAPGSAPRRCAGMACANELCGRGWTPILGGARRSAARAVIVRAASAQALVDGRASRPRRRRRRDSAGAAASASAASLPADVHRGAMDASGPAGHGLRCARRLVHRCPSPTSSRASTT